jgi:DNA-binding transcriptional LysR family regulator
MDLVALTDFNLVARYGGFGKAARATGRPKATLSRRVTELEAALQLRLFERGARNLKLTEEGRALYERTAALLTELDETATVIASGAEKPRGRLRISAPLLFSQTAMGRIAAGFALKYPDVRLEVTTEDRAVDMIEEGYDLVIRTVPPPDSTLVVRRLTPWRHILVCAPSYLETHPMPETPADVANHNCLQYAYYPYGDEWRFERPGGEQKSVKISGNVVSNSAETLRHLTMSGQGIFLAPSFVVFEDLSAGRVVRMMPDYRAVEFTINAVYPNRSHLPTKVRLFIDLLVERFAEHRKWMT